MKRKLFLDAKKGSSEAQLELGNQYIVARSESLRPVFQTTQVAIIHALENSSSRADEFLYKLIDDLELLQPVKATKKSLNLFHKTPLFIIIFSDQLKSLLGFTVDDSEDEDDNDLDDDDFDDLFGGYLDKIYDGEDDDDDMGIYDYDEDEDDDDDEDYSDNEVITLSDVISEMSKSLPKLLLKQITKKSTNAGESLRGLPRYTDKWSELSVANRSSEENDKYLNAKKAFRTFPNHMKDYLSPKYKPFVPEVPLDEFFFGFYWWLKAAEQGLAEAQTLVGCCYYEGMISYRNIEKAIYWWIKAAEQDEAVAKILLESLYIPFKDDNPPNEKASS